MYSFEKTRSKWKSLGGVPPTEITDERLQLHWASQIASAVGTTILPAREDDSQTNFEWIGSLRLLAGEPVGNPGRFRGAIRPEDLSLTMIDEQEQVLDSFGLKGKTYRDGMAWMQSALERQMGSALPGPLRRRELELPSHPTDENGNRPFEPKKECLEELAFWFSNADLLQRELAAQTDHASPVRCWPHHFDHAMLISLEPSKGFSGKSIGIGLSMGDQNYDEPYWYVNPYPSPDSGPLPSLTAGVWHTTGWTGAVLTGSVIVAESSTHAQAELCTRYISSAVDACRTLAGR